MGNLRLRPNPFRNRQMEISRRMDCLVKGSLSSELQFARLLVCSVIFGFLHMMVASSIGVFKLPCVAETDPYIFDRAFADYVFGSLILHFFCINFIN